jgi:hypothetical protein
MIKYWKAFGIDSLNSYAQQGNLIRLFSHLFENEKIVCLYFVDIGLVESPFQHTYL